MVYKCINGLAPNLLKNLVTVRNQNTMTLQNIFFNQSKYGKRAFVYYASRYWNIIPVNLRCIKNVESFKTSLKSYLMVHFTDFKQKVSYLWYWNIIFRVSLLLIDWTLRSNLLILISVYMMFAYLFFAFKDYRWRFCTVLMLATAEDIR